jgi:hypothetical protein
MAFEQLSDAEALALNGTVDAAGVAYPQLLQARWAEAMLRALARLREVAVTSLCVLPIQDEPAAVGVTSGSVVLEGVLLEYAGSGGSAAVTSIADNDTALIYGEKSGSSLVIAKRTTAQGWPTTAHVKLAKVEREGGVILSIQDMRFAGASRQAAAVADIADPGAASAAAVAGVVNELLGALRAAGVVAA